METEWRVKRSFYAKKLCSCRGCKGSVVRCPRKVKHFQNVAAKSEEFRTVPLPGTVELDFNGAFNSSGTGSHYDNGITHVNRFIDVMCHENDRCPPDFPK